jgi:glycosyltransferase involved in cell wall biosynthesis
MPHTISERKFHQAAHYRALRKNVYSGAWFVCVSDATRKDLLNIFPELEDRCVTIHNMVSHHYFKEASSIERVAEIIRTRMVSRSRPGNRLGQTNSRQTWFHDTSQPFEFLLMVSTIEPRKNHLTLLSAWERLRLEGHPSLKLLLVGDLGWHNTAILRRFRPWLDRGDAVLLEDVAPAELRLLYKHARATVCPSFGEGFGLSGVEAMACGGVVVASNIPAHREVYGEAAEYFNPYSAEDMTATLRSVLDPALPALREELASKGAQHARRYGQEAILQQWEAFLRHRVTHATRAEAVERPLPPARWVD